MAESNKINQWVRQSNSAGGCNNEGKLFEEDHLTTIQERSTSNSRHCSTEYTNAHLSNCLSCPWESIVKRTVDVMSCQMDHIIDRETNHKDSPNRLCYSHLLPIEHLQRHFSSTDESNSVDSVNCDNPVASRYKDDNKSESDSHTHALHCVVEKGFFTLHPWPPEGSALVNIL